MPRKKEGSIACIEHVVTARAGNLRETIKNKSRKGLDRAVEAFRAKHPTAKFGAVRETMFEGYGWTKISREFMGPPQEEQVWGRGATRTECEEAIQANIRKKQDEAHVARLMDDSTRAVRASAMIHDMDLLAEERKANLGGITWAEYARQVIDGKLNSDAGYLGHHTNGVGYIENHMNVPTVAAEKGQAVKPFVLGKLLLGELTQAQAQEWLDSLGRRKKKNGDPYTAQTRKLLRNFLRMVYYQAQTDKRPVKDIIWDQRKGGVRIAKPVHVVKARFSDAMVDGLFHACESDLERGLVALSLCSLRAPGEVVAVRWRNIRDGVIKVEKQIREQQGRLALTDTKTRSVRDVPIPPGLLKFIMPLRAKDAKGDDWVLQGGYRSKSGRPTPCDGCLSPGAAQDAFDRIVDRMKAAMAERETPVYDEFSIYCCRKTALTALSKVADPKVLMSVAGHTSVATTMQYYLDASHESKIEAVKRLTFGAAVELPA